MTTLATSHHASAAAPRTALFPSGSSDRSSRTFPLYGVNKKFTIEEIANGILVTFIKHQTSSSNTTVTGEVTGEVRRLLQICDGERSRVELQSLLGLKHEDHFRKVYLLPSLLAGLMEMTRPKTPKSRMQRYRLTHKGKQMLQKLEELDI